ncbi:TlpA family protein disulfide reductase [Desulfotalea psychrophila]|uniref:Related to cytochrome c biogenesis protein (TlpA) n=1 Tax=Desulfotalea psychrophila (strain LSv54 / DSM 12343) TaxID=177439 RepID=Q6AIL8_DESPS|nr:TlpA disulfide reductase family protein [Desulfotalea psychrophila]CAG37812.1 related to cytochrome c biogenesis protein (TlpA) [Desulfotalea psychrophila LSv54]
MMKKKHIRLQGQFLFVALMFFFLVAGPAQANVKMPSFSLQSAVDNSLVESKAFTGNVLLVTFFATWCPPCIQEVDSLIKLQKNFVEKGFSVVALSVDQVGVSKVKDFVSSKGINYPVLMADQQVMRDFGGIYGIPVGFLVNRLGNVVKRYTGYVPEEQLEKDIIPLL